MDDKLKIDYKDGKLTIQNTETGKFSEIAGIKKARLARAGSCYSMIELAIAETQFFMDKNPTRFPLLQLKTDKGIFWVNLETGVFYNTKPQWNPSIVDKTKTEELVRNLVHKIKGRA